MKSSNRPALMAGLHAAVSALLVSGCASLGIDRDLESVSGTTLRATEGERDAARAEVGKILAKPLTAEDASRIAVAFSPSFQAMLAEAAARSAEATQATR